jgi:hypothetical protein
MNSLQPDDLVAPPPGSKHREKIVSFLKAFPKWFGFYLGVVGLFSFNCFILEEAFQTTMFASWAAFDAREYRLVKREIDTLETLRVTLKVVNLAGGWTNPFGFVAYGGYVDAEREYIDALSAKLFAQAPELFDGEIVTFEFMHQEEEPKDGYSEFHNGRITVLARELGSTVTGRVMATNGKIIIDAR